MLFFQWLWKETIFRLFIPLILLSPFWLWWVITLDMPMPWILNSLVFIVGIAIGCLIEVLLCAAGFALYENIWEKGYLEWKKEQDLPPSQQELELEKIIKLLHRHRVETIIKDNNPTAAKVYEEYQILLALTDGVKEVEDIVLDGDRYLDCLKTKDEL